MARCAKLRYTIDVPSEPDAILARAFFRDPAWLWAIPDDRRRERVLAWFFRAIVRYAGRVGEVRVGKTRDAAAILLPPDKPRLDNPKLVRAGLWQMLFRAGPGGFSRFLTMRRVLEERHDVDVGPRHWYVWLIGVDPPRQGRGAGSALLASICADADRDGVPCYLDTTNERNLPFYRRLGFEVVYEGAFAGGGCPLWTLVRAARPIPKSLP